MAQKYEIIVKSYSTGYENFERTDHGISMIPIGDKDKKVVRVARGLAKILEWPRIKLTIERVE